jgi:hypothetical protein
MLIKIKVCVYNEQLSVEIDKYISGVDWVHLAQDRDSGGLM